MLSSHASQKGGKFRKDMAKWLKASRYGTFIPDTNIIPFKCPLAKHHDEHFYKDELFHWEDILEFAKTNGKPIKYVIDLTFTDKYYKSKDLPPGINHYKIMIPGKKIPKEDQIQLIFDIFNKSQKEDVGVGVHCTHGKNRTGLIIAWNLIVNHGYTAENALAVFNKARGSTLDHKDYITHLYKIEDMLKKAQIGNHNNGNQAQQERLISR